MNPLKRGLWPLLALLAAALTACGGGGGGDDDMPAMSGGKYLQPANTTGRLLASNCFQCHGTGGVGGFDNIRGSDAAEVRKYLSRPASSDIMAAHAQGYTSAQLDAIIAYLQQR